jgi:putative glutamine amidotransferase
MAKGQPSSMSTKSKPVIGVTLSARRNKLIWLMHKFAVFLAGGKARKITAITGLDKTVDGYVIGGGDDIGLEINGNKINPTITYDADRDALELETLHHAFATDKPVLGICRGAQMLNMARGGTLFSDLSDFNPRLKRRRMVLPRKTVHIDKNSKLYDLLQQETLRINALHHQSVNKPGKNLITVAKDTEDVVQAIECQSSGNLLGVQWHPELIPWSRSHRSLFKWLVNRANERKRNLNDE